MPAQWRAPLMHLHAHQNGSQSNAFHWVWGSCCAPGTGLVRNSCAAWAQALSAATPAPATPSNYKTDWPAIIFHHKAELR